MKNTETMNNQANIVRGEFRRGLLVRAFDQIKVWNQRRKTIRQLNSLSDRMLKDIGIDRFDISDSVRNSGSFAHFVAQRAYRQEVSAEIRRAA